MTASSGRHHNKNGLHQASGRKSTKKLKGTSLAFLRSEKILVNVDDFFKLNSPRFEEVEHKRVRVFRRGVKSSDLC